MEGPKLALFPCAKGSFSCDLTDVIQHKRVQYQLNVTCKTFEHARQRFLERLAVGSGEITKLFDHHRCASNAVRIMVANCPLQLQRQAAHLAVTHKDADADDQDEHGTTQNEALTALALLGLLAFSG